MSKRLIAFALTLALIFSCVPTVAFAADVTATLNVADVYAVPGATVTVPVKIEGNPGILGATLTVSWDEGLTLVDSANGAAFTELTYQAPSRYTNGCNFVWYGSSVKNIIDGDVLVLTFEVPANAAEAQVFDITVTSDSEDCYDINYQNVDFSVNNGSIRILTYKPGDVTDDDRINPLDLIRLSQYISDGNKTDPDGFNVTINVNAANVNQDTRINPLDLIWISQYISDGCKTDPEGFNRELYPAPILCAHDGMQATEAKPATCEEDGNEAYWYCPDCDKYFSNAAGTAEIAIEDTVITATGHGYAAEWSYDQTYHWYAATCEHSDIVSDRSEHTFGNDRRCTVCNMSTAPDPAKPYKINYKLVEYNRQNGDAYLETLHIDNANSTWFSATDSFELVDATCGEAYTFNGWYTENGVKVTKISAGATEDITLYARWTENTFDITYNVYQTPVGEITEAKYLSYKPSKGLASLPNPEIYNYVFLGWYTDDGVEVKSIPVGTTGDITLNPYLTSKRNLTKAVSSLEDPIIIENSDDGVIYFTYELGTIENVPLSNALWSIQNVAGLAQQKSEEVTTSISEEKALEIADMISKTTVDSATWTLSQDWNDMTSVSEEWAKENGMTVEEANEMVKTESGTVSLTDSYGGSDTTTTTDGTTTVTYDSKNETKGQSAELGVKIGGSYSNKDNLSSKIAGTFEVSGEISGGYKNHKDTNTHTGTDTTDVDTTVTANGSSWNKSETSTETKSASQSESVKNALSEIISKTKGYGKSYSSGGENSESQEFSASDSKSVSTTSALTYFSSETKTTTTT